MDFIDIPQKRKAHCNRCLFETWHDVLFTKNEKWKEDIGNGGLTIGHDTWDVLQCCGCNHISVAHKSKQFWDEEYGDSLTSFSYYPPIANRKRPRWFNFFEVRKLATLIDEIYIAVHNRSMRLATLGIRTLLEHIIIEKVGDQGSFKKNVDKFQVDGYISNAQRAALDAALEVGHATTHRGFIPKGERVLILLDIAENIIESVYISKYWESEAKDKLPPRKK